MRRAAITVTVAACALAAGVDGAGATNECRGLNPCVPIHGPWVAVPVARSVPRPQVQYQLTCPRNYIVGGLDAELTDRAIDVAFLGKTGSPINPGITSTRSVVFVASYTGSGARAPTFRPSAGCVPSRGGGRRTPTAVAAVVPPGQPTVRRVTTVRVVSGTTRRIVQACRAGEYLVAAYRARAYATQQPPAPAVVAGLSATQRIRGNGVVVTAHAGAALRGIRAVVQVAAVCAGGR